MAKDRRRQFRRAGVCLREEYRRSGWVIAAQPLPMAVREPKARITILTSPRTFQP
jgi:hypothetical protein